MLACLCNTVESRAAWSCCEDDWYCPQCGQQICWLTSTEQYPADHSQLPGADSEIWAYPSRDGRFLIRFFLYYPSAERELSQGAPVIAAAELRQSPDFEARVQPAQPGLATTVELVPRKSNQSAELIPRDGLKCQLKLSGNFPPTHFKVRMCRTPNLRWEIQGRGIRRSDAAGANNWLVQRRERLDLQLRLYTENAPVKLAELSTANDLFPVLDPRGTAPELNLYEVPAAGSEISEAASALWRLRVDGRCFNSVGQKLKLAPKWQLAGGRSNQLPAIEMKYAPSDVAFEPHELAVSQMYWGEVRSNDWENRLENPDDHRLPPVIAELLIRNDGDKPIKLRRPEVPAHKEGGERWLETDWLNPGQADESGNVELPPNSSAAILVLISFQDHSVIGGASVVDSIDPGPRGSIRVTAADESDFWPVTIQIGRILPRKPCPFPLAIDFGNSYSYAAILNEGIIRELPDPILAVHDRFLLEEFPTTLAIRRFLPDQPLRSDFVIGVPMVASPSSDEGGWPVSDLKRWLGQEEGDPERSVIDAGKETHYVRVSILVQMFIYGVIQRAEAILRQYHVSEIVTSYPAKLTPAARRHYVSLVDKLCEQITIDRTSRRAPLKHCHGMIDEANAVATGFVLDNEQYEHQADVVEDLNNGFVIASFDFGGGSLDTALLRFRIENPDHGIPAYSSAYLGIGGRSDFGGDNVTVSVMELLLDRIASKLPQDGITKNLLDELPAPQFQSRKAGVPRELYDTIWTVADWCKRLLCSPSNVVKSSPFPDSTQTASPQVRAIVALFRTWLRDPEFLPSLDDVYEHQIRADQHGKSGYTVQQRLKEGVEELARFASRHSESGTVNYIVLGGGGTRIPLVQEELKRQFPDARIVFNPNRLKCRVAEGLVRTIDYLNNVGYNLSTPVDEREPSLALSGQCTTRSLGVLVAGTNTPIVLIPVCTKVDPSRRFPFVINGRPIALRQVSRAGRLTVYADVEQPRLRRPVGVAILDDVPSQSRNVSLCFAGHDEESLRLVIETDGQLHFFDLQEVQQ